MTPASAQSRTAAGTPFAGTTISARSTCPLMSPTAVATGSPSITPPRGLTGHHLAAEPEADKVPQQAAFGGIRGGTDNGDPPWCDE